MKYKVNDEVLIKARIKDMSYIDMMYVCELVTNPDVCIRFKSPTECIVSDKTYYDGLNDAWNLAKKIVMGVDDGGFDSQEVIDVFGKNRYYSFKDLTAAEALAKIEAYEKEKSVCVGDVVIIDDDVNALVVDEISEESVFVLTENGCIETRTKKYLEKTDKKIPISGLLRQIGE